MKNLEEIYKKIGTISKKKNDLIEENKMLLLKLQEEMGIDSIKVGKREEYDDNNHFDVVYIDEICVGEKTFNEEITTIDQIEENIHYMEDLEPQNSARFSLEEEGKEFNKYTAISEEDVQGIEYGELMLFFLKRDGSLDYLIRFLDEVMSYDYYSLPSEWRD